MLMYIYIHIYTIMFIYKIPTVFNNKPCRGTVHVQTIKSSVFPVCHRVRKVSIHSVGLAGGTSLAAHL